MNNTNAFAAYFVAFEGRAYTCSRLATGEFSVAVQNVNGRYVRSTSKRIIDAVVALALALAEHAAKEAAVAAGNEIDLGKVYDEIDAKMATKTPEQITKHAEYAALCTQNLGRAIVVALMTRTPETETQYAILADGRIAACTVNERTPHFGKHRNGRPATWTVVTEVPAQAEYIGTYAREEVRI